MPPETVRAIDEAMAALTLEEQLCLLLSVIVARRPAPTRAVISALAATMAMAQSLPYTTRVMVAELARDAADAIEQRQLLGGRPASWAVPAATLGPLPRMPSPNPQR